MSRQSPTIRIWTRCIYLGIRGFETRKFPGVALRDFSDEENSFRHERHFISRSASRTLGRWTRPILNLAEEPEQAVQNCQRVRGTARDIEVDRE